MIGWVGLFIQDAAASLLNSLLSSLPVCQCYVLIPFCEDAPFCFLIFSVLFVSLDSFSAFCLSKMFEL